MYTSNFRTCQSKTLTCLRSNTFRADDVRVNKNEKNLGKNNLFNNLIKVS